MIIDYDIETNSVLWRRWKAESDNKSEETLDGVIIRLDYFSN